MAVFSPQPLKKWRKSQNVKNAQVLQWILNDDDVYFKKNFSILNWEEFFHSEKYRVFTQYAAATILRHWATMS